MLVSIKRFLTDILTLRQTLSGAVVEKLLWENPEPKSFSELNIPVDLSHGESVLIEYVSSATNQYREQKIIPVGGKGLLNMIGGSSGITGYLYISVRFAKVSTASVNISKVTTWGNTTGAGNTSSDQHNIIPTKIYRIKHLK